MNEKTQRPGSRKPREEQQSSGAVLYTCYTPKRFKGSGLEKSKASKPYREYLIVRYEAGHWDFVKGTHEEGETLEQTALREIEEETGFRLPGFVEGFEHQHSFSYWGYPKKPGERSKRIYETTTLYLAEAPSREVKLSHEHTGYAWLPYKEALSIVTHDNAREAIRKAERFLRGGEEPERERRRPRRRRRRRRPPQKK